MLFAKVLMYLLMAHCLCDYSFQTDFIAKGKNPFNPLPGVPWYQCLFAHAMIHAGMVLLITKSPWLALAELVIHALTDYAKCAGWFGSLNATGLASVDASKLSPNLRRILGISPSDLPFNIDQAIHYGCKILWAVLAVYFKVP